jgi:hypothetical protein
VIVARLEHPFALNQGNVDLQLIAPHVVNEIREWFRNYKTFEGKGLNEFGFGGRCLTSAEAAEVFARCYFSFALWLSAFERCTRIGLRSQLNQTLTRGRLLQNRRMIGQNSHLAKFLQKTIGLASSKCFHLRYFTFCVAIYLDTISC